MHTPMFVVRQFTTVMMSQLGCPWTDKWREHCVYTMYIIQPEYDEVLSLEAARMIIMLRETS